jgi:hypothetical protein
LQPSDTDSRQGTIGLDSNPTDLLLLSDVQLRIKMKLDGINFLEDAFPKNGKMLKNCG